jgi:TetR/AcrR family transcriptional regulator
VIAKVDRRHDTASMAKAAASTKTKKRRQGRPVAGENNVGRELLLAATERLLRTMPPSRVTIARVAQEANADPSLVRYYFGDRTSLLVAVVDRVTAHAQHRARQKGEPVVALAEHIGRTVQFVRSAPFMHRLMIDELAQAGAKGSRARVKAMNQDLVDLYRELLAADGGNKLVATNPLFLHLAVLGASDFFATAEPLIRELAPKGTDMEELGEGFQAFLVKLVLEGLRKR